MLGIYMIIGASWSVALFAVLLSILGIGPAETLQARIANMWLMAITLSVLAIVSIMIMGKGG